MNRDGEEDTDTFVSIGALAGVVALKSLARSGANADQNFISDTAATPRRGEGRRQEPRCVSVLPSSPARRGKERQ